MRIIKSERGWGYEILYHDKVLIHQEHIPAIAGFQAFATKDDAIAMAKSIINKMKGGQLTAVTTFDTAQSKTAYGESRERK